MIADRIAQPHEGEAMHIRVVRFSDVTPDRVEGIQQRINERGGPPEGVTSSGVQFVYDADQQTAVVIQHFDSEDDMRSSIQALEAMDPSETPGTRVSVDAGEVVAEVHA
jgi:hypothetical protein